LDVVDALIANDSARGLEILHQTLDSGADARTFARQTIDHLRNILLTKAGNASEVEAPNEIRQRIAQQAQALSAAGILSLIRIFNQALNEERSTWLPALPLEIAFLEGLASLHHVAEEPPPGSGNTQPVKPTASGASPEKSTPATKPIAPATETASETPLIQPAIPRAGEETARQLEEVKAHWREIRARVRQQNPHIEALLNSCRPMQVKDGRIFLVFNGEFAKQKFERPEIIKLISNIIKDITGLELEIQCLLSGTQKGELPPGVSSDGIVAAALRMGGEIVDIQD
jgi:DNA polymerase-3 subunit gamma/tau